MIFTQILFHSIIFNTFPQILLKRKFGHDSSPVRVDSVKFTFFCWHFLFNIIRGKNRFKVHPTSLDFDHKINSILDKDNFSFNKFNLFFNIFFSCNRRCFHHEQKVELVIKNLLDFISSLDGEGSGLFVGETFQIKNFNFFFHFF